MDELVATLCSNIIPLKQDFDETRLIRICVVSETKFAAYKLLGFVAWYVDELFFEEWFGVFYNFFLTRGITFWIGTMASSLSRCPQEPKHKFEMRPSGVFSRLYVMVKVCCYGGQRFHHSVYGSSAKRKKRHFTLSPKRNTIQRLLNL